MKCENKFINCLAREHCFISCNDNESCKGSIINCPINGDCIIGCHGIQSCQYTTIDATLSHGNLDIECDGNDISCKGLKVFGSTLHDNIGNFNLICKGNIRSCIESNVLCPYNGNCIISCMGDTSCTDSKIIGPNTGDLIIECNDIKSCFNSIFDGSTSNTLNIKGCMKSESCLDLSIYCPPHTNDHKNCFLEGNDNLGKYISNDEHLHTAQQNQISNILTRGYLDEDDITVNYKNTSNININTTLGKGITIYALYGWKDIDINYKGTFGIEHVGKMICGNDYKMECDISPNKWFCVDDNSFCNDVTDDILLESNVNVINVNTTQIRNDLGDVDITGYMDRKDNVNNSKLIIAIITCVVILFCCVCIGYIRPRYDYEDHIEGDGENILQQKYDLDEGYEQDSDNKYENEV